MEVPGLVMLVQSPVADAGAVADAVQALTLPAWKAYFERVFLKQRHSLQVVGPGKWGVVPKGEARAYDSAEAI